MVYLVGERVKWGINVALKGCNSDFKMVGLIGESVNRVEKGGISKKIEVKAVLFGKDTLRNKEEIQKVKERKKSKMQKCGNKMSIADQRAMLEKYNKVRAEKDAEEAKVRAARKNAKKKGLHFRPGPAKKPFCAYCKVEGHWLRDKGVVVCVKLVARQQNAARRNEKKRESARMWRNEVSKEVSKEMGSGGWDTVGKGGKKEIPMKEEKKGVVKKSKNPFDMGDESDESEDEIAVKVPKVMNVEVEPKGAWSKPLEVGAEYDPTLSLGVKYDPTVAWGDQDD